jgi:CHAD domain-containing protein
VRNVRRFLSDPACGAVSPPRNPAKAVPTLVRHFLPDETWRAYEEVIAYETLLRTPRGNLEVIHKVRSSCRRLRYALELFADALPRGARDVVVALRALQDRLGDLHDHAVAVDRIERWLARGKLAPTPALESYRAHRAAQRDDLRAEFDAEWRALTGDAFRYTLSHLVSGEMRRGRPNGAVRLVA